MVRSPPRRSGRFRVLLALLLLTAFAAAIVLLTTRHMQVGEVRVPAVVGSSVDDATRALRALGFEVSTYTDASPTGQPDRVTSQTPGAEAVVRRGRGIALGVSARNSSTVPNLVGLSQTDAVTALTRLQLAVGDVELRHAPRAQGTVLAQRPRPRSAVASPEVDLSVSLGPKPRAVLLPNFVGVRLDTAQKRLERLGFRRVEAVPTRLGAPGVNAQTPRAGSRAEVSAQVTLYYTVGNRQVVPVPSVLGLDLQRAAERLQASGLRVGQVTTNPFDPSRAAGVSKVKPPSYTLWGTAVELETNGNAGPYRIGSPALPPALPFTQAGGQSLSGAQSSPQPSSQPGQQPGQTGSIIVQQPVQPVQTERATTLDGQPLQLPAAGGRDIPITYDPADYAFLQGRAYGFQVQVTDEAGERIALDRDMGPDEPVEDTVTVYGEAEVRMYIDGQIIFAYNPPAS